MVLLCCLRDSNFQKLQLLLPTFVSVRNSEKLTSDEILSIHPDILILEASAADYDELHKVFSPDFLENILLWGQENDILKDIVQLVEKGLHYLCHPVDKKQLLKYLMTKSIAMDCVRHEETDNTGIIGNSHSMFHLRRVIKLYGALNEIVTITGETGTGKDITARALHGVSRRRGPFTAVNCAAIPETLIESELFGSVKGAFTDSIDKIGYFEAAHGGTLFLDEIGDLPLSVQTKLLRILEDKHLNRLGSTKAYELDIRIVCATSRNLKQMMEEGLFRRDLYYRLNILRIDIPPLRQRKMDIPQICTHLLEIEKSGKKIQPDAMMKLLNYSWPGNVRELKSILKRAEILSLGEMEIRKKHIDFF